MFDAFADLSTERQVGMGVGPIAYRSIVWYFQERQGLEGEALDEACTLFVVFDALYLKHRAEEDKKKNKPPSPGTRQRKPR